MWSHFDIEDLSGEMLSFLLHISEKSALIPQFGFP